MTVSDTIAALSTPSGTGGISIIRISGPDAVDAADGLFVRPGGKTLKEAGNFTVSYGHIYDRDGNLLDEVLVTKMLAPHTYTTEDVVEINCHGGAGAVRSILSALFSDPRIRPAMPGEFTRRAFTGGRIDLSQAEAVSDIINATSESFSRIAASQIEGSLKRKIDGIKEKMLEILSDMEVSIQYPEYDLDELKDMSLIRELSFIRDETRALADSYRKGEIMRSGLRTAIVGRPNVGKSMLLNALLGEDRAIVTDVPGTTRDVVDQLTVIDGIPVRIMDTAGIRESSDLVESIGIERSIRAISEANLVIVVADGSVPPTGEDLSILKKAEAKDHLLVLNKSDKGICPEAEEAFGKYSPTVISAMTGDGLDTLEKAVASFARDGVQDISGDIMLINARHMSLAKSASEKMDDAIRTLESGLPEDLIETDLRDAWRLLGEITGETADEDIVDRIFERFCLGK